MSASTRGGPYGKILDQKAPIVRLRVSNKKCEWSNVSVLLQPAKTAQTLQMRAKKFSHVIKARNSPTADTVIKYQKLGKKKLVPITIGFTLGDSYVLVSVDSSYFSTSEKQLQAVADEIATLLPDAPKIEYKQREPVKPVDFCKVWEIESLKSLYNLENEKDHISPAGGRMGCGFTIYPVNSAKVSLYVGVDNKATVASCQNNLDKHGYTRLKDYGNKMVVYKLDETSDYRSEIYRYCFDQGDVSITTQLDYFGFSDEEKERIQNQYKTQLKPLSENIIKRITFK